MQYDISVIIEWENALLAEQKRCSDMLTQLRQQVHDSLRSVEVLVLFNPEQVGRGVIEEAVAKYLVPIDPNGRTVVCRIAEGIGLHYYQLKNLGAKLARGQVIAFADSDSIPEEGWLHALTNPFWEHPEIQVLAGLTYLDPEGLLGRAFALGWFFPLRSEKPVLNNGVRRFFANNVAFRRQVFESHPFPEMAEGMTRGACVQLAGLLRREGIVIWSNSAARSSHPAPNGLAHFAARGLAQGRDWAMAGQENGTPVWRTILRTSRKVFPLTWRMLKCCIRHGRTVGLPVWQVPLAVGLMSLFYLEYCLGACAYALAPDRSRRWWRI